MKELTGTPIRSEDAVMVMKADIAILSEKDANCPLARAIEKALAALEAAIEAHKPD